MPKVLCIARHAEYTMQPAEQITDEGFQQIRQATSQMHELGLIPDFIASSPLSRACQTANAFRDGFQARGNSLPEIGINDSLSLVDYPKPEHDRMFVEGVHKADNAIQTLLLVTHQPQVESFARTIGYSLGNGGRAGYAQVLAVKLLVEKWSELQYFSDAFGRGSLFPMPEFRDVRFLNAQSCHCASKPAFGVSL